MISTNKHETETLWVVLVLMFALYANMLKVSHIEGDGGLLAKLADAFLAGQTYLLDPPPEEWRGKQGPFQVAPASIYNDYSLFDGRFYLPYGPVPVLLVFLPYKYVTGADLNQGFVAFVFACGGTILMILLYLRLAHLLAIRNNGFFRAAAFLFVAGTFIPVSISWPMHYQAIQMMTYFFIALALLCMLNAFGSSAAREWKWIAAASVCFGLAAGCRQHFVLAGAALIVPALYWLRQNNWRLSPPLFVKWACLFVPWALCAAGLLYYNELRFGSLWDFGTQYQITWKNFSDTGGAFSIGRVLINLYFLLVHPIPVDFSYPFFHPQPCCAGAFGVPWQTDYDFSLREPTYGALTNAPFLWFSFLSLWMIRRPVPKPAAVITGMLWLIALPVFAVLLLIDSTLRYLVDVVPWLMLAACLAYAYTLTQISAPRWLKILGTVTIAYTLACGVVYGFHGYWYVMR